MHVHLREERPGREENEEHWLRERERERERVGECGRERGGVGGGRTRKRRGKRTFFSKFWLFGQNTSEDV
jgi:hypothetical protein